VLNRVLFVGILTLGTILTVSAEDPAYNQELEASIVEIIGDDLGKVRFFAGSVDGARALSPANMLF